MVMRLIFALPKIAGRVDSISLDPPSTSRLVQVIAKQWQDHPGKTGVAALENGADAFAARMQLVGSNTALTAYHRISFRVRRA